MKLKTLRLARRLKTWDFNGEDILNYSNGVYGIVRLRELILAIAHSYRLIREGKIDGKGIHWRGGSVKLRLKEDIPFPTEAILEVSQRCQSFLTKKKTLHLNIYLFKSKVLVIISAPRYQTGRNQINDTIYY